jgi:hypothetical protein
MSSLKALLVELVLTLHRRHKGRVTRLAQQACLPAEATNATRVAGASTRGTTPKITAAPLVVGKPNLASLQQSGRESTMIDRMVQPELTATS